MKAMLVKKLKLGMAVLVLTTAMSHGVGLAEPGSTPQPAVPTLATRTKSDLDAWQGVWKVTRIEQEEERSDNFEGVLLVHGDRVSLQGRDGERIDCGLYLDPASVPKAYDLPTINKTFRGIYSLKGDVLTICHTLDQQNPRRPTEFRTRPADGLVLFVLRRDRRASAVDRLADGTIQFAKFFEQEQEPRKPQPVPTLAAQPVAVATTPTYQPTPRREPRVGTIHIVGNDKVPDTAGS